MPDLALLVGGFVIGFLLRKCRICIRMAGVWSRLANRRMAAVLLCAGVAMLPRLALLPWLTFPEPAIQDEFSNLLGAQTLAAARLTNPTPALWQHFESFHINLVPTYQSMYQPGSSLFYALGIVAGGNPWWGVWLSTGLMCGAICWALQPLLRPRYALLAGLFCAMKYGIYTTYSDSYWGGSVCALGAALALGACVRLRSQGRLRYVLPLICGVALLANTRIFEGFLFAIPLGLATAAWMIRQRRYRALALAAALLSVLFAGMGYYNLRGTGRLTQMPYMANFQQYHFVRPFLGSGMLPRPPYRHASMARMYEEWEGEPGLLSHSAAGIWKLTRQKFSFYYKQHFSPLLLLALLGTVGALKVNASQRYLLVCTFWLVAAGLFAVVYWPLSAYPAPLLVSFFGLCILGIRYLRAALRRKRALGLFWARGIMAAMLLFALGMMISNTMRGLHHSVDFPLPWNLERVRIVHDLERRGGRHLILVKYAADHPVYEEWVYNGPDIGAEEVIWARSMSNGEDCRLIQQYAGRQVWVLEPDAEGLPTMLAPWGSSPILPPCQ
jgi:hypothetical protein